MSMEIGQIGESDEAFARRLQAQEMGISLTISRNSRTFPTNPTSQADPSDPQTPLMTNDSMRPLVLGRGNNRFIIPLSIGDQYNSNIIRNANIEAANENNAAGNPDARNIPSTVNNRMNELATSRTTVIALAVIHIPQIVATAIILGMYWNDSTVCTPDIRDKWNWWSLISAIRMLVYLTIIFLLQHFRLYFEQHLSTYHHVHNIRNVVDLLGLVWFLIGNLWIFGENDGECSDPTSSPVYNLCLSMLIITMVQGCFPCILSLLLIPVLCCCMPCLIRLIVRLQNMDSPKGATDEFINTLPVITLTEEQLSEEKTCPVCLNDMAAGEEARSLPCKHLFHRNCVDEWLRVNASCPTCRTSIIANPDAVEEGNSAVASSDNDAAGEHLSVANNLSVGAGGRGGGGGLINSASSSSSSGGFAELSSTPVSLSSSGSHPSLGFAGVKNEDDSSDNNGRETAGQRHSWTSLDQREVLQDNDAVGSIGIVRNTFTGRANVYVGLSTDSTSSSELDMTSNTLHN